MPRRVPFSEADLRAAIAESMTWAAVLRALGYAPKGSNYQTVKGWAATWENSTYRRGQLKDRLFAEGLKQRLCELCGQGEVWNGRRMSLVLDHINGVSNDHRLENLQVVCANCAATLDTHCGRNVPRERTCPGCGGVFAPKAVRHRYCSQECWGQIYSERKLGVPQPHLRKVDRPSYEQLIEDVRTMSFPAIGRKYGVSDNAVRKWIRWYERGKDADGEADVG